MAVPLPGEPNGLVSWNTFYFQLTSQGVEEGVLEHGVPTHHYRGTLLKEPIMGLQETWALSRAAQTHPAAGELLTDTAGTLLCIRHLRVSKLMLSDTLDCWLGGKAYI